MIRTTNKDTRIANNRLSSAISKPYIIETNDNIKIDTIINAIYIQHQSLF